MFKAFISFLFFGFFEAFFAMSEIAFVSAEKSLIERMATKNPSARIVLAFWKDPERLFTITTLGITLSIAGNGFFTSYFLIKSFKNYGLLLSSTLLPLCIILLGQILPKGFGKRFAYPLVLYLAPFLYLFSFFFYPIYFINSLISQIFFKKEESSLSLFKTKFREVFLTMISYEEEIDHTERKLMHRIMEFGKKKISQVMIPLSRVKALPITATLQDALEFSTQYNFTYIPLYERELSHIKFIVKVQDLLGKNLLKLETPLFSFAKTPLFIPEIIPAHEALKTLQKERQEMAVVVDEYGLASGIITIEDLVEEVLGEFRDALDYTEAEIIRLSDNTFLVKGYVEIEKLQEMGIELPSGDYETISGFLYQLLNRIPRRGETITYKNLTFFIKEAKPNRIEEILIKPAKKES